MYSNMPMKFCLEREIVIDFSGQGNLYIPGIQTCIAMVIFHGNTRILAHIRYSSDPILDKLFRFIHQKVPTLSSAKGTKAYLYGTDKAVDMPSCCPNFINQVFELPMGGSHYNNRVPLESKLKSFGLEPIFVLPGAGSGYDTVSLNIGQTADSMVINKPDHRDLMTEFNNIMSNESTIGTSRVNRAVRSMNTYNMSYYCYHQGENRPEVCAF